MKYRNSVITAIISALLALVGFIHLRNSVNWGRESAGNYLSAKAGGSMDTNQFQIILEHYIITNRWIGIILLSIGLLFLLWNIQKIDSNNKQVENKSNL